MKVTIAYLPDWESLANAVATAIKLIIPNVKIKKSDHHTPFKHIYMTTKKPEKSCGSKETP